MLCRILKIKEEANPRWWSIVIPTGNQITLLKTMLPIIKTHFLKRCFRKINAFSDFRFEGKTNKFYKYFYAELMRDGCIKGAKVKS